MPAEMLTIAWGWEGMLAVLAFLFMALVGFVGAGIVLGRPPWRAAPRAIARQWRAMVLLALALFFAGASFDALWGATHVRLTRLTVSSHHVDYDDDGGKLYYVADRSGHRFVVRKADWHRLHDGDRVQCRTTDPLVRTRAVLSCEPAAARPAPQPPR